MLFNSIEFLLFLPIVVAIHFGVRQSWRMPILLVASYIFYMSWKLEYGLLMLATTLAAYGSGFVIGQVRSQSLRVITFGAGIAVVLGLLFAFKYYNFFNASLRSLADWLGIAYSASDWHVELPVGISFYTFQAVGYIVDVYRGTVPAERNLPRFCLFVSFFPQLVAGPIERSKDLLPQIAAAPRGCSEDVAEGLRRITWGFFKKVVLADNLAVYVNDVFNHPETASSSTALFATYCFVLQVYFDFAAYSDIAIGSARLLGYKLSENFVSPLTARSITELWQRWHITLSHWIRDYLYIPLVLRLRGIGAMPATVIGLFVAFTLVGLWHGAAWKFVLFGALHGVALSLEALTARQRRRWRLKIPSLVYSSAAWLYTFHFFAWTCIYFRANSISDAHVLILQIASFATGLEVPDKLTFAVILGGFAAIVLEATLGNSPLEWVSRRFPEPARMLLYYGFIMLILSFGRFAKEEFIYFQF